MKFVGIKKWLSDITHYKNLVLTIYAKYFNFCHPTVASILYAYINEFSVTVSLCSFGLVLKCFFMCFIMYYDLVWHNEAYNPSNFDHNFKVLWRYTLLSEHVYFWAISPFLSDQVTYTVCIWLCCSGNLNFCNFTWTPDDVSVAVIFSKWEGTYMPLFQLGLGDLMSEW